MNKRYYISILCPLIIVAVISGCMVYPESAATDNYTYDPNYTSDTYYDDPVPPVEFYNPPELVVIPETYVYVVPDASVDIFFYDGWWWRPWKGRWYQSRHYKSGWRHYRGVPHFYRTVPRNWKSEYRNHRWRGHEWNHQRIPYKHLERNWRDWENRKHWERNQHWGVKDFKPDHNRHDQPDRRFYPDRNHNNRPDRFEPRNDNNNRPDRFNPRNDNRNRPDRFEPRNDNRNRPDRFEPRNDNRNRPDRFEPRNDNRNRPDRFNPRNDNNVQKERVMPEREHNRRERQDRRHRDDAVQPPPPPRNEQRKIEDAREQILENKRRYDEQLEINKDSP